MGADVVVEVEAMALRERQPLRHSNAPLFEWRPYIPINDEEENNWTTK